MTDNSDSTDELRLEHLDIVVYSLVSFIIVTTVLWLIYFINYAILARRKVHFYQNISESYQISKLINSYMDLRRSQLICAILVCAILTYLCMIGEFVAFRGSNLYENDCNLTFPFDVTHNNIPVRVLLLPSRYICTYTALSLIVILTSYLSKAYSITRVVVLKERNLFVWMCADVIIILLIHSSWVTFILLYPLITVIGLLKLCLLAIYIRRMNNGISINHKSANLTESLDYARQMQRTYHRYLFASWGLFAYVAACITLHGVIWVLERVRLLITSPCVISDLFGFDLNSYKGYHGKNLWDPLFKVCDIIELILCLTLLVLLFMLHLGVFKLLVCKQLLQCIKCCRKSKRTSMRSASVLVQPLLT